MASISAVLQAKKIIVKSTLDNLCANFEVVLEEISGQDIIN